MRITVSHPIEHTPRVAQVAGMFDLEPDKHTQLSWEVELPLHQEPWNIGLIVGPSGCGKSTIAKHLFPNHYHGPNTPLPWPQHNSILDAFPEALSIKDITQTLNTVGFSSPPAWLRPYHVLSTGQQFRVTMARLICHAKTTPTPLVVLDEYTSVIDRNVAQIASAALSRAIRQANIQFVAVTCHDDVEPWLNPDWVHRPAENRFTRRLLQRRPAIKLSIFRCHSSAWQLFAPAHYLSHSLSTSSVCFLATYNNAPAVFSSWIYFFGGNNAWREHRTVTLPDYQGVGMGNAVSDLIASMWSGLGYRATSTTTHPAMIHSRNRSPNWIMVRAPAYAPVSRDAHTHHAATRLTAGFRYVGPALPKRLANALLNA